MYEAVLAGYGQTNRDPVAEAAGRRGGWDERVGAAVGASGGPMGIFEAAL